jgi:hypothetical protein
VTPVRVDSDRVARWFIHAGIGLTLGVALGSIRPSWFFSGFLSGCWFSIIGHKSISEENGEIVIRCPWKIGSEAEQEGSA